MRKTLSIILMLSLMLSLSWCLALSASATIVTDTVNVPYFSKNMSGAGYEWNNRTRTLTLTNLHIVTTSQYGLKVPDGSTVVLNGTNIIEAAFVALATEGEVTFTGEGTLELIGGSYGIYGYGTTKGRVTRFMGTELSITAGTAAIRFDYEKILFENDSNVSIQTTGENALTLDGVVLKILDSTFTANAPLQASQQIIIQNSNVSVFTDSVAIPSIRSLSFDCVSLQVGASKDQLTPSNQYTNEAAFQTIATGREGRSSIIFGDSCPAFVDYILFGIVLVGTGCLIAFPIIRQKKKDKLARTVYEKEFK